jgi:anti-sigma B factor antagonist
VLGIEFDEDVAGNTICRPVGDIDSYSVSQFRQVLAELADCPNVVIDMSRVYFLDSAGLAALIGGIRRARERGGDVAVVCGRPGLYRLLRRVGLDRIVTVSDDIAQATNALRVAVSLT